MFYELLASAKNAAATNGNTTPEWQIALISAGFGLICGLIGTAVIDWLRERRRKKNFCKAVSSELKQLLALSLTDMIYPDAKVDEKKIKLIYNYHEEFDLTNQVFRHVDIDTDNLFGDSEKAVLFMDEFRKQRRNSGNMMSTRKMNCNFINNNFEIIGLLEKETASRIINLINRIESRNHIVDGINDAYSRSFDNPNSLNIIKHNYYSNCQQLSDNAVNLTKVITELISLLN